MIFQGFFGFRDTKATLAGIYVTPLTAQVDIVPVAWWAERSHLVAVWNHVPTHPDILSRRWMEMGARTDRAPTKLGCVQKRPWNSKAAPSSQGWLAWFPSGPVNRRPNCVWRRTDQSFPILKRVDRRLGTRFSTSTFESR